MFSFLRSSKERFKRSIKSRVTGMGGLSACLSVSRIFWKVMISHFQKASWAMMIKDSLLFQGHNTKRPKAGKPCIKYFPDCLSSFGFIHFYVYSVVYCLHSVSSRTKSYLDSKQNGFEWLTGNIDPASICKHTTSEQEQQIDATSSSVQTTARIPLYKDKQQQNIGRHAVFLFFFFTFIWTHPVLCFWWFPTVVCYWPLMGLL